MSAPPTQRDGTYALPFADARLNPFGRQLWLRLVSRRAFGGPLVTIKCDCKQSPTGTTEVAGFVHPQRVFPGCYSYNGAVARLYRTSVDVMEAQDADNLTLPHHIVARAAHARQENKVPSSVPSRSGEGRRRFLALCAGSLWCPVCLVRVVCRHRGAI